MPNKLLHGDVVREERERERSVHVISLTKNEQPKRKTAR